MSKFSDKDFFGDPIWPSDFNSQSRKLQDLEAFQTSPVKKHPQNQEPNENPCNSLLASAEAQDYDDLEKAFIMEQQKMLYSNFKHSEITYLDDYPKGLEFPKDDLSSSVELSHDSIGEDSHERELKRQAEIKFEKELENSLYNLPDLQFYHNDSESSMTPESEDSYGPEKIVIHRPIKLTRKQYDFRSTKVKIQEDQCKVEQEMILEIINECINVDDEAKRKRVIEQVEESILKKLQADKDSENSKPNKIKKTKKKILQKTSKTHKYKILSERQKEYLVYLSTTTTTCEVARRFNISVNNICRWKKGTKRKIGAGRKIVNLDLEQKVIDYVKDLIHSGEPFTRRQIQVKARQLSDDENFKASKGWFERFYNRNIDIFVKSSSYQNK